MNFFSYTSFQLLSGFFIVLFSFEFLNKYKNFEVYSGLGISIFMVTNVSNIAIKGLFEVTAGTAILLELVIFLLLPTWLFVKYMKQTIGVSLIYSLVIMFATYPAMLMAMYV